LDTLNDIKNSISSTNLALLKVSLPKFYRIKLTHYPSSNELKEIEKNIKKNPAVIKIESFKHIQNNQYRLLLFNKTLLTVFAVFIFVIAILLVIRQMEIWHYQHIDRMSIMSIFGANSWIRSAVLYRLAIIDSIVSTIIVSAVFFYIYSNGSLNSFLLDIGLEEVQFDLIGDSAVLFLLSFCISLLSVIFVIVKSEKEIEQG
jgi:cell division transport system permease protein